MSEKIRSNDAGWTRHVERLLDAVLAKPEVAIMTGEKIADWYSQQVPPPKG